MNGDYASWAEVDGTAPDQGVAFTPGVDFDPGDSDSVGAVLLASGRDLDSRRGALVRRLWDENAALRGLLGVADPAALAGFDE